MASGKAKGPLIDRSIEEGAFCLPESKKEPSRDDRSKKTFNRDDRSNKTLWTIDRKDFLDRSKEKKPFQSLVVLSIDRDDDRSMKTFCLSQSQQRTISRGSIERRSLKGPLYRLSIDRIAKCGEDPFERFRKNPLSKDHRPFDRSRRRSI